MEQTIPIKQKKKLVQAVTLAPEFQERVVELARVREWSVAQTGGYLIKLGLQKLEEIAEHAAKPQTAKCR